MQKEALAPTWAHQRFQSYLIGMDFLIQTDHKPLISFLGSRALDDLPPHILRFRLRLLHSPYKFEHIPGTKLITGDALSRKPVQASPIAEDIQLEQDVFASINLKMESLPATEQRLVQNRTAQDTNDVCKRLKNLVRGWPRSKKALPP